MKKIINNEKDKNDFIQMLKDSTVEKPHVIEFKKIRKVRSLPQNRLYWLWLRCIEAETGNDSNTLHKYFSDKYLPQYEYVTFGRTFRSTLSTSDLDTKQFDDYIEKIRIDMLTELNIHLPLPEEQGFETFYTQYS